MHASSLSSALFCTVLLTASCAPHQESARSTEATAAHVVDRYEAGQLRERYSAVVNKGGDTVRHGPCWVWHGNGSVLSEETYRDGVLDGPFATWDEKGQKLSEGEYQNGKLVSEKVH
jgi:hypothetical protein